MNFVCGLCLILKLNAYPILKKSAAKRKLKVRVKVAPKRAQRKR